MLGCNQFGVCPMYLFFQISHRFFRTAYICNRPSQFTGKGSRSFGAVLKRQMSGFKICISIFFALITRAFDLSVSR